MRVKVMDIVFLGHFQGYRIHPSFLQIPAHIDLCVDGFLHVLKKASLNNQQKNSGMRFIGRIEYFFF